MYEFSLRPGFGQELAAQRLKQHKSSQFENRSLKSPGYFPFSSFFKDGRIGRVTLALLTGCVVSVLAGCGGVSNNSNPLSLSAVSCGTKSLTGAQSTECLVNLSTVAKNSTAVTLASSDVALNVPKTVNVAAGAKTAVFSAVSQAVSKSVSVTITAEAGSVTKTDVITLNPVASPTPSPTEPLATLSKISCATQALTGPTTAACSVYLSGAATSLTEVILFSNNGALQAPTSVNVPLGATSVGFTVTALAVSKSQIATLTAAANGVSQTDPITLNPVAGSAPTPAPVATLSKLSCATQTLTGAATTACTVYLSAAATSQTVVTLASNNKALQLPASVNVAAGATTAAFNVTASAPSTKQTVTLTASANGVTQTGAITINPATTAPVASLSKLSCATQQLTGPTTTTCTVYLSAAAASQTVVTLASNNKALQPPASVNVGSGATSATFNVTASALSTAQSVTLTATANGVTLTDAIQLEGATSQPGTHTVQLSWNAPASTSDPVVGYHVYRATSGGSDYTLLVPAPDTQTSYDDTTVKSGAKYDYIVKSVDSDGVESAASNSTSVAIP